MAKANTTNAKIPTQLRHSHVDDRRGGWLHTRAQQACACARLRWRPVESYTAKAAPASERCHCGRRSDTFAYSCRTKNHTSSCYLISYNHDYMLWDTGFTDAGAKMLKAAGKPQGENNHPARKGGYFEAAIVSGFGAVDFSPQRNIFANSMAFAEIPHLGKVILERA